MLLVLLLLLLVRSVLRVVAGLDGGSRSGSIICMDTSALGVAAAVGGGGGVEEMRLLLVGLCRGGRRLRPSIGVL